MPLLLALALFSISSDTSFVKVTAVVGIDRNESGHLTAIGIVQGTGCANLDSAAVASVANEIDAPDGLAFEPANWWRGYHYERFHIPRDDLLACAETQSLMMPLASANGFELREVWSAARELRPSLWEGPPGSYRLAMILSESEASTEFIAPQPALRFSEVTVTPERDSYTGEPQTRYDFTPEDGERLREFTRNHIGQAYAIVVDGRVRTVATIIDELGDSIIVTQ